MSMANTVCWVDVPAKDLDRAVAFYTAVLGADVMKMEGIGMQFALLPQADDNVSGCIAGVEAFVPARHGPLVCFNVEGRLDAAFQALRDGGGEVVFDKQSIGPHGFRAVAIDSEGNRFALHAKTA